LEIPETSRKSGRFASTPPGYTQPMRVMLATYLVVIVSGLVFFTVVGLSHG
jgi:hypothetical protein